MLRLPPSMPLGRVTGLSLLLAVITLAVVSCSGTGGGWLAARAPLYGGQASFGFSFSCERASESLRSLQPKSARLRIQLSYTEHGTNPLGGPFSIHGEADTLDPVLESAVCLSAEDEGVPGQLIFLGPYRSTSSGSPLLTTCSDTSSQNPCRFEVIVQDNDRDRTPSPGDFFSIKLAGPSGVSTEIPDASVIYARAGHIAKGEIRVD